MELFIILATVCVALVIAVDIHQKQWYKMDLTIDEDGGIWCSS